MILHPSNLETTLIFHTLRFNQAGRPIGYACVDMLHMAAANGTSAADLESLERVHPEIRLTGGASPDL